MKFNPLLLIGLIGLIGLPTFSEEEYECPDAPTRWHRKIDGYQEALEIQKEIGAPMSSSSNRTDGKTGFRFSTGEAAPRT